MSPPTETPRSVIKEPEGKSSSDAVAKSLETLRQITAPVFEQSAIFDEGAAAVALGAVLEAVRLRHGALFVYDSDRQSLSLLAQQGLSASAQAAVRLVRRGMSGVWDMPLHSLLQRRVYIIDRPKENPFVPVLLEGNDQNLLSNLAFIPLYSAGKASGVLLLVGSGARTIREPDILALREHAKILGATLSRPDKALARAQETPRPATAPETTAVDKGEVPTSALVRDRAALAARVAELEALVDSLWEPGDSGAAAETERRLADLTRERDQLKGDLASREFELLNLKADHEFHRQRGTDETERARKLALELAQAREQIAGLLDRAQLASDEKNRADRLRGEIEGRLRDTERRFAEFTESGSASESERAGLALRIAQMESETAEHQEVLAAREQQVQELRAERERVTASLQATASRAQESQTALARLREDTAQTIGSLQTRIESLETRLRETEREGDQLRAASAGHEAVTQEIERETESIRAELAREVERRRAAEETYSSVIRDASELHAELERIKNERLVGEAETQKLRAETERLTQEIGRLQVEHTESARNTEKETAVSRNQLAKSERERKALESETKRLQDDLAAALSREEGLRGQKNAQEEETRKLRVEVSNLHESHDHTTESLRSASRERDAMAAKVAALEERISTTLREGKSAAAEHHRLEEEMSRLRTAAEDHAGEMVRLRADLETARTAAAVALKELESKEATAHQEILRRQDLERQLSELRIELERSQTRGSELTAETESRRHLEEELRAAAAAARSELDEQQERLRGETEERAALAARLAEMEEVLRGAAHDLPAHAHDLDGAATLRATLERSEAGRRAAEESAIRLESALEAERSARETARAEADDQRRAASELAIQVEESARRLQETEAALVAAGHRAESLSAEHAATAEMTQSLASDLGRRTAEIGELKDRLQSVERELGGSRKVGEEAQVRIRTLDEAARTTALEIAALRRQGELAEEDKRKLAQEFEIRLAGAKAREERLGEQLAAVNEERQHLLGSAHSFDAERQEITEALRQALARGSEVEVELSHGRAEVDKLTSDLDSLRRKAEAFEDDLRAAKTESARWQALNEKLQATVEERDREILALREAPPRPAKEPTGPPKAASGDRGAVRTAQPPASAGPPPAPKRPPAVSAKATGEGRTILIFDGSGPSRDSLSRLCREAGVQAQTVENGAPAAVTPQLVIVNLLSTSPVGLEALYRSRTDDQLRDCPVVIYAAQPGSAKGLLIANIDCLFRPLEEERFKTALAAMIQGGKRVTIIGEDFEGVLRLNGWATSAGCSVSSAGDPKQGSDLLDIVKPDLIVLDLPRLSGEGAALIVKVRRSQRLHGLPLLLLLPPNGTSPTAGLFLKRLATLAEEAPLDLSPLVEQLSHRK